MLILRREYRPISKGDLEKETPQAYINWSACCTDNSDDARELSSMTSP